MSSDGISESENKEELVANCSKLPTGKRKYKNYDLQYKMRAIEYAKTHSNHSAANEFAVSRTQLINWRKQKEKIAASSSQFAIFLKLFC